MPGEPASGFVHDVDNTSRRSFGHKLVWPRGSASRRCMLIEFLSLDIRIERSLYVTAIDFIPTIVSLGREFSGIEFDALGNQIQLNRCLRSHKT